MSVGMARIVVAEPVAETRELLEHLVARLGHELVDADGDVVLLEPVSCFSCEELLAKSPRARVVLQTVEPTWAEAVTGRVAGVLLKPFGSGDLRRVLDRALAAPAPSVASVLP